MSTLYTIGHSKHSIEKFIELLERHNITVLADVRSTPFSRRNPQYNRDQLKCFLRDRGIKYVFLGEELGARPNDPACNVNCKVQYDRLADTELFKCGLKRIQEGVADYCIALMCAEKDPLDCHRAILVARHLSDLGLRIRHILSDGSIEEHEDTIERLLGSAQGDQDDLFLPREERIHNAYKLRANAIAYTAKSKEELSEDRIADDSYLETAE